MSNGQQRQSVVEILNSPINISRKNTFFSSIPETKDLKNTAEIRLANQFSEQNSSKGLQLEKLLASEEHPFKINAMTYCTEYDMLSVGLSNGQIVNYTFEIESFAYTSGTDTSISPQDQRPKKRCKYSHLDLVNSSHSTHQCWFSEQATVEVATFQWGQHAGSSKLHPIWGWHSRARCWIRSILGSSRRIKRSSQLSCE